MWFSEWDGHFSLYLARNGNYSVHVCSYSDYHIDVDISVDDNSNKRRFTGFYGSPRQSNRQESWNLLRRLRSTGSELWYVCRDFNEIMYAHEKKGGETKDERQMEEFQKVLAECDLIDLVIRDRNLHGKREISRTKILEKDSTGEWQIMSG